jgi:hypothetical protein
MRLLLLLAALVAAAPLHAQDAPAADVRGVWEMTAVEKGPPGDELVFLRLTISDSSMHSLAVLVETRSGALGLTDNTQRLSRNDAGDVVLGAGRSANVLKATLDGTELALVERGSGISLRLRRADAQRAVDPGLLGTFRRMARGDIPLSLRFGADGSVRATTGDEVQETTYELAGPYLILGGEEVYRYTVHPDRVELDGKDGVTVLERGVEE